MRRDSALALVYVGAFLLLDWVSFIHPFHGLNITPWNPQPAVAIALLLRRPRWIWLVWLSVALADVVVRGVPSSWLQSLLAAAALALTYAAIARAAQVRLDTTLALGRQRDLYWFTAICIGGALLAAAAYVVTVAAPAMASRDLILEALARYWLGDAVGLVVTLPILVMVMDPVRRASLASTLRRRDFWLVALMVPLLLMVVFGIDKGAYSRFFYLLLLPVVWAAARMGLTGAVLSAALTQAGLIFATTSASSPDLTVFELQMLMAAVTMTGLMLGVTVDERERTAAELKGSLRLAAAGQMAAALAHELSQPLTALNSYAEASRELVSKADMPVEERMHLLSDISSRMAADAMRASAVVKRLRDFFRTGSTQLQVAAMEALVQEGVSASARRAQALDIDIQQQLDERQLPSVLIDPVQIGVVLRNLLTNAIDAAAGSTGTRKVKIQAIRHGGTVLVEVLDSGPGVPEEKLHSLFEAGSSDKPGGMGVGLSICRAIVEAHGGALWAQPGPGGHFCFSLPIDRPKNSGARDAP